MIYFKWLGLTLLKLLLLPTLLVAPFVIAGYTRAMPHDLPVYSWGSLWGTFDNPPQGDEGFCEEHAFFPNVTNGWKGYINRVQWMWRNKLYGFNKLASLEYNPRYELTFVGNEDISDKRRVPGYYFARLFDGKKLVGFEFYCVKPWGKSRNIRVRLGWKMMTRKFFDEGFAPMVNTCNPFDGYGNA